MSKGKDTDDQKAELARIFSSMKWYEMSPHKQRMGLAVRPRGESLEIMREYARRVEECKKNGRTGQSATQSATEEKNGA